MKKDVKIFVASHKGMIGFAILQRLKKNGFVNVFTKTHAELDLTNQKGVTEFFSAEKPDYVFLTSSMIGGILANSQHPAEFIYTNLMSQSNIIHCAWKSGVKKLLFFGSSCIYPKECPQPMKEEYLLNGKLEPTSEPYAIAKIAGIRMCQSYNRQYGTKYISVVPADVYGPEDDFNPETGHVLPALISKMHWAKTHNEPAVVVWGTGSPRRDCLYVDDLADAGIFLMDNYDEDEMINVGSGKDIAISELAWQVKEIVGFQGRIVYDKSKPDGAARKFMDCSKANEMGWASKTSLEDGIKQTYEWYMKNMNHRDGED